VCVVVVFIFILYLFVRFGDFDFSRQSSIGAPGSLLFSNWNVGVRVCERERVQSTAVCKSSTFPSTPEMLP